MCFVLSFFGLISRRRGAFSYPSVSSVVWMPQTIPTPVRLRMKKTMTGRGSSIWAMIGEIDVKILVMKLHIPSAVAANKTGKTVEWLTYRMLKADEMPNLAIKMNTGNHNDA